MKLLSIATFTGCSWLLVFPIPSWPWLLEPHVYNSRCISKKKRVEVQLACKKCLNLTSYNGPWVSPTSKSLQNLLQRLRNFNLSSARVPSVAPPTKYDLVQQPWLDPESEQRSLKQLLWEQHAIFHKHFFPTEICWTKIQEIQRFKIISTISKMEPTQQIQNSCKIYFFWKIPNLFPHFPGLWPQDDLLDRDVWPSPLSEPGGRGETKIPDMKSWKTENKLLYQRCVLHFLESKDYCIFAPPPWTLPGTRRRFCGSPMPPRIRKNIALHKTQVR